MKPIPEACHASLNGARAIKARIRRCTAIGRGPGRILEYWVEYYGQRRVTRETIRALRAARRAEGALVERWGAL